MHGLRHVLGRAPNPHAPTVVKPFADLLDRLLHTPQRNVKIALILDYFRTVPDPDPG